MASKNDTRKKSQFHFFWPLASLTCSRKHRFLELPTLANYERSNCVHFPYVEKWQPSLPRPLHVCAIHITFTFTVMLASFFKADSTMEITGLFPDPLLIWGYFLTLFKLSCRSLENLYPEERKKPSELNWNSNFLLLEWHEKKIRNQHMIRYAIKHKWSCRNS